MQRRVASEPGKLAFLEHPQDFALHRKRHFANFVEKERAAVALFEPTDPLRDGSGETALLVPEKLAFEQRLGDGSAVDRHEKFLAATAIVMNGAGDEFFARSALARDHHRGLAMRDAADHLENLLHRLRLADDAVLMLLDGELRLEGRRRAHFGLRLERRIDHHFKLKGSDSLRIKS